MEYDKPVCQYIIKTLNIKETSDEIFKKDLKKKFGVDEKSRIRIMSILMQSGAVEARQKGDSIIYSISKKLNLKKRPSPKEKIVKKNLK